MRTETKPLLLLVVQSELVKGSVIKEYWSDWIRRKIEEKKLNYIINNSLTLLRAHPEAFLSPQPHLIPVVALFQHKLSLQL